MNEKPNVLRQTDEAAIAQAKALLRTARHGALATLDGETGFPMASRVGMATDLDGSPLLLVSLLASHTRALIAEPRCSLLVGEPGRGDPLAHPRLAIKARARLLDAGTPDHARAQRRYLNHNPKAALYAGLGDFRLFRLELDSAAMNGGFGKAYKFDAADMVPALPANDQLAETEQGALDHMNADHSDAIDLYAARPPSARGPRWRLSGIDAEGLILAQGDAVKRVAFPAPLASAAALRAVLVEMTRAARAEQA